MYPALEREYGDCVTFEEDPAAHVMVEFSFDVVQIAGAGYLPRTYHNFVGFRVAKPLLERAFKQVYGLKLGSVLFWEDLSIKVYRTGASEIIPALTQAEWKQERKNIVRLDPSSVHPRFQYRLSPQVYSRPPEMNRGQFDFMRPWKWHWPISAKRASVGWFAAATVWLIRVLPKVGPLHRLEFRPPTLQVQKLFVSSFDDTVQEYEACFHRTCRWYLQ
jgi:hypothetical protein